MKRTSEMVWYSDTNVELMSKKDNRMYSIALCKADDHLRLELFLALGDALDVYSEDQAIMRLTAQGVAAT